MSKRWNVMPEVPHDFCARFPHLNCLLLQMLYNRGVTEPQDVDAFLNGRIRFDDPFRMTGIPLAVERIRDAIRRRERIFVYGDFDADGVTATALMVQTLRCLGADVEPYIPHRVDEGYGLHCSSLDRVIARGARLVVTVDCGIRSLAEVAYARERGLDIIVTDHHSIRRNSDGEQELPPALAVVNPRKTGETYPFSELAGVGIAFKLAQALLRAERDALMATCDVALVENELLDLVALGTVADLAMLQGENRILVQRGLAELNKPRRPGVVAMLNEAGLAPGRVDATAIGFVLGPRLNAAGRLETADLSYRLLTAPDVLQARPLAEALANLNRKRQQLTDKMVSLAKEQIGDDPASRDLYLVTGPDYPTGIVGLVASRLTEDFYRPSLVAQQEGEKTRGSARSIAEFDITAALDECRDLLVRYGGHAMAAGFTVETEKVPQLQARLEEIAGQKLAGLDLAPVLQVDAVCDLMDVDEALCGLLLQLEPCGMGNPQPILASYGVKVRECRQVGSDGKHLKLTLGIPGATGMHRARVWDAIAFRWGTWYHDMPQVIDIAYTLERNVFNGHTRLQLNVKDIREAQP